MKHRLILLSGLAMLLVGATFVIAHPHFNKTLTVKLPSGAEATLTYNTTRRTKPTPARPLWASS